MLESAVMSLYTRTLTKEEATARFEASLAKMVPPLAAHFRACASIDETPGEGALWLRQAVGDTNDGATIGALQDASLALLGYHNTLVLRDAMVAERKAWARTVNAERDAAIEDESGVGDDGKSERELRAAKQALRDLGVNVDALLA